MQITSQVNLLLKLSEIELNLFRCVGENSLPSSLESHRTISDINKQLVAKMATELEELL